MNYNIPINQKAIVDNNLDIDIVEAFIIEAIRQTTASWDEMVKIIDQNKVYYWLSYDKIIKDNPMLRGRDGAPMKKDTIYRYVKSLCEKGFLEGHNSNGKSGKTFFALTNRVALMYGNKSEPSDKNPNTLGQSSERPSDKNPYYNNTNYNSTESENLRAREEKEPETDSAYTQKYLELCDSFAKPAAPVGELDLSYRQENYPATFGAAEAKEKLTLFISNSTNAANTCAAYSFAEGLKFNQAQWAEAISQFIAYHFSPTGYQSQYCKDFPAIVRGFGYFIKRNKGTLGKQRPEIVPTLESVLECAQKAHSNTANPEAVRRFFAVDIVTNIYGQVADKIKAVSEGSFSDMVPLSAEEFVRFVGGAMGRKDIILKVLDTLPATKKNTKYLDGYKTIFACLQAQTKYILR